MTQIVTDCGCGKTHVQLLATPRLRFRCHCTICQRVYDDSFSDALVFRRGQVKPTDPDRIKWVRMMRPSPLRRGLCKTCDRPVLAHLYGALSLVPTRTVSGIDLPPISRDLYYGTRVADIEDGLAKHDGALATYVGCTLPFSAVLLSPGRPVAEV